MYLRNKPSAKLSIFNKQNSLSIFNKQNSFHLDLIYEIFFFQIKSMYMFTIISTVQILVYKSFCNTVWVYDHVNKASCRWLYKFDQSVKWASRPWSERIRKAKTIYSVWSWQVAVFLIQCTFIQFPFNSTRPSKIICSFSSKHKLDKFSYIVYCFRGERFQVHHCKPLNLLWIITEKR